MDTPEPVKYLGVPFPEEWERLKAWYRERGLTLFPLPVDEDGMEIYGIGIGQDLK